MDYVILTDVSCDLAEEQTSFENFGFIEMEYSLGNEMRRYDGSPGREEIRKVYESQRGGELTKTSQITPFQYESTFEPWLGKGLSILYLSLSGGLSGTFTSARIAADSLAEKYPGSEIHIVDTKAATGGMGILTERALRNREAGMSAAENEQDLLEAVRHIYHWFLVQDLKYLQRGGRVSAAAAAVGTLIQIKPILQIDRDGRLTTIAKARGNQLAAARLLKQYDTFRDPENRDPVYVIDADDPDLGDRLRDSLLEKYPDLTIRRHILSPIIGAHTGPGMAAIIHIGRI